jgi:hypothetical protein
MQRCSATGGLFHINSMLRNQQLKPCGCMVPQLHQSPQWSSLFAWFCCSTCAATAGLQGELLARHLCVAVSQGSGGPRSSSSLSCTCTCITIHFSSLTDTAASASVILLRQGYRVLGSPGASPGVFVLMPGPMCPTGCLRLGGYTDGRSTCYRYVDRVQQRRYPEGTTAARCSAVLAG